ncbi:MATE family efflux transporter [Paenibacillus sp. F411]|uniref:MATE family efflux transporter n=1 Tax=Paenibacillus sp. F411 TaxID=2820239 RepID=UPI001AB01774|nr:MATE family efflux transporter [Paenibacillus sp. F411]MBO2944573.1 MATE family efflux transporter [Paenibacillus sp. F411]
METHQSLQQDSVKKVFFRYFFPSLLGMMLMSVNILIDGVFVGNGVGAEGLAGVNLAMPVFSLIFAIALWIGIGGGTLYSIHIGGRQAEKARSVFTLAVTSSLALSIALGLIGAFNIEDIALLLGSNEDTLPHTSDYLKILFQLGWLMALQQVLSIFVRNDGSPGLSMVALGLTAVVNIGLNYIMIFTLGLGVRGAALATVTASFFGILVLLMHFFKKKTLLGRLSFQWSWRSLGSMLAFGFPSFFTETGVLVLVAGYNLAVVNLLGTNGVAAFSVINYLHSFMFLTFFGIEAALQPMISYYHGAKQQGRIRESVRIGETTSLIIGILLLTTGLTASSLLVSLFGLESPDVQALAVQGISLFFIGYLFLGFNFVYLTYYQSIGEIKSASLLIVLRSFVFLLPLLWLLPRVLGINGVWLSFPVAEGLAALLLLWFRRTQILSP